MSVRRLAANQPDSFAFSAESLKQGKAWIARFPEGRQQSAVIPMLWIVQKQQGWVSEPAIRVVAEILGMPVIRVYEVATFYTMFMLEPVGSLALVQVCGTTPCMLRGANDLKAVCQRRFGDRDHMSPDGKVTWQEVECLGACSNAPMAAINDYYYEDLTPEIFEQILDEFIAGKPRAPGSVIGRQGSAPEGGSAVLQDASLFDGSAAKALKALPNAEPKTSGVTKEAAQ
ncbi:MAG: NADH-quinone oxidoreductase subunit NuoE [Phenylobacterium sp.]|uniref:NADH-quinone oxidoreductase subunit NuoE n=1 Tax=Phenylobacterium sp. TaxID=1871053 RepID=UPI0030194EE1